MTQNVFLLRETHNMFLVDVDKMCFFVENNVVLLQSLERTYRRSVNFLLNVIETSSFANMKDKYNEIILFALPPMKPQTRHGTHQKIVTP